MQLLSIAHYGSCWLEIQTREPGHSFGAGHYPFSGRIVVSPATYVNRTKGAQPHLREWPTQFDTFATVNEPFIRPSYG
jgi:hypothetical protein